MRTNKHHARGKSRILLLGWTIGITLAGCGKSEPAAGGAGGGEAAKGSKLVASCDQRNLAGAPIKNCIEYMGSMWTEKEVKARCGMEGQAFIAGACPAEGVVFSCVQEAGKPMEAIVRAYDQLERAQKSCKDVGGVAK